MLSKWSLPDERNRLSAFVFAGTFAALLPETPTVDTASASPKPIAIWRTRRERLTFIVINFPPFV
jgi:hypothetical protein